ncbi:hypothetical protein BKA65DRAFT_483067 [Rhexocercosporidium sp. MPI-PUGE-AT-0058]|nr:hypothetical protein BKA65DRAFT_483067 [Rhexocercosporidium sp. MPI-PUGE-AT-0058]
MCQEITSLDPPVDEPLQRVDNARRSAACSDILRRHMELYPTSSLLRGKIQEIVRSAEHNVRQEPNEYFRWDLYDRSLANSHRTGAAEVQPSPGSAIDVNLHLLPRQVYTKHSFLSKIKRIADSCDANEFIPSENAGQESTVLEKPVEPASPQQFIQPESTDSALNASSRINDRQEFTRKAADYDMTRMLGPDFAVGNAEYDVLMDPFLHMQNGLENGPWNSEKFPGSDQKDTFCF